MKPNPAHQLVRQGNASPQWFAPVVFTAAMGFMLAGVGHAALVVQDPFQTGPNPAAGHYSTSVALVGQDPTIAGWSGAWYGGTGIWTNLATGLAYSSAATSGTIGAGGAVQRLSGQGVGRAFAYSDALTYSNSLWLRLLIKPGATNSSEFVLFRTQPGANNSSISPAWSSGGFQVNIRDAANVTSAYSLGVGNSIGTNLIVFQILRDALDGTMDVTRVWLNPTSALNDTNATLLVTDRDWLPPYTQFLEFYLNHSSGSGLVDEVALANTAADLGLNALLSPIAPAITSQPQNSNNRLGASASFTVGAIGTLPISYQWRHAGTNLAGATASKLSLAGLTAADTGAYQAFVTNVAGAITSSVATLTLYTLPPSTALVEDHFLVGTDPSKGEYALAALAAQNPVTAGFDTAWSGAGTVSAAGLSYNSGATAGPLGYEGAVTYGGGTATRNLTYSPDLAAATNLWFRLLMKPGTELAPYGEFFFFRTVAGNRLNSISPRWAPGLQNGMTDKFQLMLTDWSNTRYWYLLGTNSGGTHLVVMNVLRDASNGTNEVVKAWFNPTAPLSDGNVTLIVSDKDFLPAGAPYVQLFADYTAAANSAFDEIGIATNAADLGLVVSSAVVPPSITAQPQNTTNWLGDYAQLTVGYLGTSPSFQWRHAGTNLPGRTEATLLLAGITAADAGAYVVVLTNYSGSVTSQVATLTAVEPTTIVEEDFRMGPGLYSAGVLNFQAINSGTSGRGFTPRFWETGGGWSVTAGGLTYAGPAVTGTLGAGSGNNAGHVLSLNTAAATRLLNASYLMQNATNLWARFLMDPGTFAGPAGAWLRTYAVGSGNGNSRIGVFAEPATSANWLLRIIDVFGGQWDADSGVPVQSNQTALILLQLLPDRGLYAPDTVRLWVNPAGPIASTPPAVTEAGADFWAVGDQFGEVQLNPSGTSGARLDELAVALTAQNVLTGYVPPPVLSVWTVGNIVKVGWSTNTVGYLPEVTTSLAPAIWQPAGTPVVEGDRYVITIPTPTGNSFFRLKQ